MSTCWTSIATRLTLLDAAAHPIEVKVLSNQVTAFMEALLDPQSAPPSVRQESSDMPLQVGLLAARPHAVLTRAVGPKEEASPSQCNLARCDGRCHQSQGAVHHNAFPRTALTAEAICSMHPNQ
mmetsp:Transcript_51251/g.120113  ORF Transcript_51251/g.120113 Transcript_51251/m.120113 type:complete len:124 (+) Transcript_51251:94-465(+)